MVDCRENKGHRQALPTQTLLGIQKRAQPRLVALDDTVLLVLGTFPNKPSGVGGEESGVIAEV
jgi:hypothetical protein